MRNVSSVTYYLTFTYYCFDSYNGVCVCVLQVWLCLIALGVSFLDPATRRGNDLTILIERQPEFDS